jgi:predicted RNase H-like HicB family nuclease
MQNASADINPWYVLFLGAKKMDTNEFNLPITDQELKAVTTFTIDVGEYGVPTSKCFAEVRSLGVICRGESQAEVLGRVTARVLRIMSLRMARRMVVPDVIEDLFGTEPRIISGLGQCNILFTCKPDGNGRWVAEVPDVPLAICDGATQEEATRRVKSLALWMLVAVAEQPGSDLPMPVCLCFPVATEPTISEDDALMRGCVVPYATLPSKPAE